MKIFCPECSQALRIYDLCAHRNPVCEVCCNDMHATYYDDPEGDAA